MATERAVDQSAAGPVSAPTRERELVDALKRYEAAFIACDGSENLSHYRGLMASGLTEDGLCAARSLVGKYRSGKAGILAWDDMPEGRILTVAEREAQGWML